eukprot:228085-Prorocentrum_minimum.AAC.1
MSADALTCKNSIRYTPVNFTPRDVCTPFETFGHIHICRARLRGARGCSEPRTQNFGIQNVGVQNPEPRTLVCTNCSRPRTHTRLSPPGAAEVEAIVSFNPDHPSSGGPQHPPQYPQANPQYPQQPSPQYPQQPSL